MSIDTDMPANWQEGAILNATQYSIVKKRVHESASTELIAKSRTVDSGSLDRPGLARASRRFVGKNYTSQRKDDTLTLGCNAVQ